MSVDNLIPSLERATVDMNGSVMIQARQQGVALIMFALFLVLIGTTVIFNYASGVSYQVAKERKTAEALAEAKAALIGWSVSNQDYPGTLPFPDRNTDAGGYDGQSDCVTSFSKYEHLIGKLPYLGPTAPCVGDTDFGLSENLRDGDGEQLWYAVSRNLVRHSTGTSVIINPSIADSPTYPWLIVRDQNGQVVSDRVAAVIIAPGGPVSNQNRTGGKQGPEAYLDSISINGVFYSNADYADKDEDFIMGEANSLNSKSNFNDHLTYITIDELMYALEARALGEVGMVLRNAYKASAASEASRYFPFAAMLGDTTHTCQDDFISGPIPMVCTKPSIMTSLPGWFKESAWENYIQYQLPSDCSYKTPGCASGYPLLMLLSRSYRVTP